MAEQPQLDRLKSQLLTSGLQNRDNPLFQVINTLIDYVRKIQTTTNASIASTGGAVTALAGRDFLTHSDESTDLPNSRELLAGTNIAFDDTVANERTVNATTPDKEWSVLTDGDLVNPEIIFVDGEVIMVSVP